LAKCHPSRSSRYCMTKASDIEHIRKQFVERTRTKFRSFIHAYPPATPYVWGRPTNKIVDTLQGAVDRYDQGICSYIMINVPPRTGKQIADNTPVLTPNGWTIHGALSVGDSVYGIDGKPIAVLAESEKTSSDYVVTMSNGEKIRCHGNHEWTVYSRQEKDFITVGTSWFLETNRNSNQRRMTSGVIGKRGGRYRFQLPNMTGPIELTGSDQLIDPYVLGVWLGDGKSDAPTICHDVDDIEHLGEFESMGYPVSSHWDHKTPGYERVNYTNFAGRLSRELKELGLTGNKHIPSQYIHASTYDRCRLLAGLIDSDGHVDNKGRVVFTSTNISMIDGAFEIAKTLGFRPYRLKDEQPRLTTSGIQGRKVVYKLGFNPTFDFGTIIPRKKIRRTIKQNRLSIASVEFDPIGERGKCIQVDSDDGLYLVGRTLIPTHNSDLCSRRFPPWFFLDHPEDEIILSCYGQDLANDMSRDARKCMAGIAPSYGYEMANDRYRISSWGIQDHKGGMNAVGRIVSEMT